MSDPRGRGSGPPPDFRGRGAAPPPDFRGRGGVAPPDFRGRGGAAAPPDFRGRGGGPPPDFRGRGGAGGPPPGFRGHAGPGGSPQSFRGRGAPRVSPADFRGRGGTPGHNAHGRGGAPGRGFGGGRGSGVGAGGGSSPMDQEKAVQRYVAEHAAELRSVSVVANLVPIDLSKAKGFFYRISYVLLENGINTGDALQVQGQAYLLRAINRSIRETNAPDAEQQLQNLALAVGTGSHIITPAPLPIQETYSTEFVVQDYETRGTGPIGRRYRLTVIADGQRPMQLPADTPFLNTIIDDAVTRGQYSSKDGRVIINPSSATDHGRDLITYDCIVLKVMQCQCAGELTNVLQLDVKLKPASSGSCQDMVRRMQFSPNWRSEAAEQLVGQRVVTLHGKPEVLKVKEITEMSASDPAGLKKDPNMSFCQYFLAKYNVNLDPNGVILKCRSLNSKGGRALPYPAELLRPMILQEHQRQLLPRICGIFPDARMRRVSEAFASIIGDTVVTSMLAAFGIFVPSVTLLRLPGTVLPVPTVYVPTGSNSFSKTNPNTPIYVSQHGFARALDCVMMPPQQPDFAPLIMDRDLLNSPLPRLLRRFHIALPPPQEGHAVQTSAAGAFACVKLFSKEPRKYNELKTELTGKGVMSQMVFTHLEKSVPFMVVQQMAAKLGQLCFLIDPTECGDSFKSGPMLIVGVDVGASRLIQKIGARTVKKALFTISFTAFLVEGKKWRTYCGHKQVDGGEQLLFTDGDAEALSPEEETQNQINLRLRENRTDVLNRTVEGLLLSAKRFFGLTDESPKGAVVVYRGCSADGEIQSSVRVAEYVEFAFPGWRFAMLTAQARSHTRLSFTPPPPAGVTGLCNVPRGFCTSEAVDASLTKGGERTGFYVTGAGCTLGHASSTLYVVLRSKDIPDADLQQLTYALSFMYPNKPDSLPLPLPMKCAAEYAIKFSRLPGLTELHPRLHATMHYL